MKHLREWVALKWRIWRLERDITHKLQVHGLMPRARRTLAKTPYFIAITAVVFSLAPTFLILNHYTKRAEAQTATQGPLRAASSSNCVNDASTGTLAWTNPGDTYASDNAYATRSLNAGNVSNYVKCTNFGFSLPAGATISGITMQIERKASVASRIADSSVRIVKNGTIGSTNKATGTNWPTSDTTATYGSTSDLWGETWTSGDINASSFGAVIAATASGTADASIDAITLAVDYSFSPTFAQSSFRWFNNQDSSSPMTFANTTGGTGYDWGNSLVQTTDGGYAITGDTQSYGAGGDDVFLAKYDSSGTLTWSKTTGGTSYEHGYSLVQTTDGGYAITGSTYSYGAGGHDVFLAKYDSSGTLAWSKTWGGTGGDSGNSLVQTTDGGYAITGDTQSYGAGGDDMFLAKYDSSGTLTWSKTWGGTSYDSGYSLVQTTDGGYAVTGRTYSYGVGSGDMFLAKYDSSGNLTWNKTWGGTGGDSGFSLAQTSDGGYVITGYTDSYGAGSKDMFLTKYDSSGTLSWSKTWGGGEWDSGAGIVEASDGGFVVTGEHDTEANGWGDAYIAKYDSSGNLTWNKTWGGTGYDYGNSLVQTADGGYAIMGSTDSYGAGSNDMFLAKYDSSGAIAGCGAPMCQSPTASTSSPSASTSSPTASTSSPSASTSSPTVATSSVAATSTTVVAAPTIDVGSPLNGASMNTPTVSPASDTFRLRLGLHVGSDPAPTGDYFSFKLQYAQQGTDSQCDTGFTGETFADVTTNTPIGFANNTLGADGMPLATNANDPTHGSDTTTRQQYNEANPATINATISAGQDGLWDFALRDVSAEAGKTYCFRLVTDAGSALDSYSVIPQITTEVGPGLATAPPATLPDRRSIKMATSAPGATSTDYTITFEITTPGTVKGIVVDICAGNTSPTVGATCTAPPGFTWGTPTITAATIGATDITGWTFATLNSGRTLTADDATGVVTADGDLVTIVVSGITNPVDIDTATVGNQLGTFFGRIITLDDDTQVPVYDATNGSAAAGYIDSGGVALSTAANLTITARVQEVLVFCLYTNGPGQTCATGTGTSLDFPNATDPLDEQVMATGNVYFTVGSNAIHGVTIRMKSDNGADGLLKSGAFTIAAFGPVNDTTCTPDSTDRTTEQFGMRLIPSTNVTATAPYNCSPGNHGWDADSAGTDTTTVGSTYGDTIATTPGPNELEETRIEFAAKSAVTSEAGIYTTTLGFIATASY